MAKTAVTNVVFLFLSLLLVLLSHPSTAEIKSLTIDSDTRPVIVFEKFGFTATGHVTISLSSVTILSQQQQPPPDFSLLGFFLLSEESLIQLQLDIMRNPNVCVLRTTYISEPFTLTELSSTPTNSFNRSFTVPSPNEYSLCFANCIPNTSVSMKVRTELYNLEDDRKDFLSAGQTQLPSMFSLFALAYFLFFAFWIYICRANRLSLHRIHVLMGILLLVKAINLLCAAEDMHYVKVTGNPHGWDVLFYIFRFIRAVLLFTVIVLIGTGWSFLKPFLQEREKKLLMVVIPLQVIANVAYTVMGETGPFIKDWVTWNQVFLIVDVICCFAIIFPVVWSIRTLRETSKTDGKAARNLAKLQLFKQFYVAVIGFLYFTRIVVFALAAVTAYQYRWVSDFTGEGARLVFYVVMFYMFRPVKRNEYFVLDEEEEEAAEKVLRDEEFDL